MFSYGSHPRGKPEAFFIEINTFHFQRKEVRRWLYSVSKRPGITRSCPTITCGIALALVLSRNNDRQTMFLAKPVGGAADIAYQLTNNEGGQSMQEDRTFENKFAPPVRSEKKIGNTTFTVNSFFLEQTKDGVVSKIGRLIKDDVRKKAAAI